MAPCQHCQVPTSLHRRQGGIWGRARGKLEEGTEKVQKGKWEIKRKRRENLGVSFDPGVKRKLEMVS